MFLADVGSPGLTPASVVVSMVVALLAGAMAAVAFGAARKRANPALRWVALAFVVFALKNVFSAVNVSTHQVPHDIIELSLSLFDLVILVLLFLPLVRRRRGRA
jgi:hypothetical protein